METSCASKRLGREAGSVEEIDSLSMGEPTVDQLGIDSLELSRLHCSDRGCFLGVPIPQKSACSMGLRNLAEVGNGDPIH